ncbi:Hypothetical protein NTJ_04700 [Nesidiocoris tenuis]|uniref:Uncharacterized protein n=1 Tax=Nesidiocoris tenuis TaxID=355587 RepID=A0ABN7AKR0_9HEMI|nr:Hypothetical protein NTJ_04700 [Nesidiocoris tenuis]
MLGRTFMVAPRLGRDLVVKIGSMGDGEGGEGEEEPSGGHVTRRLGQDNGDAYGAAGPGLRIPLVALRVPGHLVDDVSALCTKCTADLCLKVNGEGESAPRERGTTGDVTRRDVTIQHPKGGRE